MDKSNCCFLIGDLRRRAAGRTPQHEPTGCEKLSSKIASIASLDSRVT